MCISASSPAAQDGAYSIFCSTKKFAHTICQPLLHFYSRYSQEQFLAVVTAASANIN